jgi:hypothetical protein
MKNVLYDRALIAALGVAMEKYQWIACFRAIFGIPQGPSVRESHCLISSGVYVDVSAC